MYNTSRNHLPPKGSEPQSKDEPLPVILAGPIVRRCEYNSNEKTATVNIWLATSKNFENIFVEILNITPEGHKICSVRSWTSTFESIEISNNFWIWMLKVKFKTSVSRLQSESYGIHTKVRAIIKKGETKSTVGKFFDLTSDEPYISEDSTIKFEDYTLPAYRKSVSETCFAYNINFQEKKKSVGNEVASNIELKTLDNFMDVRDEITLYGRKLPFFSVQIDNQSLKCLFGSCRKAHGIGKDASKGMELKLLDYLKNGKKDFPNALFLTGDQIYADDVHSDLLNFLIKPLVKKLNINESALLTMFTYGLSSPVSNNFINDRAEYISDSGLTSTESQNHLIYFGEFAAMYLIMWNSKLWDQSSRTKTILKDALEGTKSIRRVLANVPTYMIIDDHDVTDDFYFNDEWKTDVLSMTSGKRIISHALANYWLFQAWGNTFEGIPANFSEMINGYTQGDESQKFDYDKTFTEYHKWSFIAPTNPPAIFLNTRTQRKSEKEADEDNQSLESGPILINNDEYSRLVKLVEKENYFNYDKKPVIVVSPSPILTLSSVEYGIKTFASPLVGDIETFNSNQYTFYQFCMFIRNYINPSHLIIVSGDVHYATIGYGKLSNFDIFNSVEICVSQFTSSALKNEPNGLISDGGLRITEKKIGLNHNIPLYYKVNKNEGVVIWNPALLNPYSWSKQSPDFSLIYNFVKDSVIPFYRGRAFQESNFGFFEKSPLSTKCLVSIRDSYNQEGLGFECNTNNWPF